MSTISLPNLKARLRHKRKRDDVYPNPDDNRVTSLNRLTISSFISQITRNPSVDLGPFLIRHTREYPKRRAEQVRNLEEEGSK